MSIEIEKTGCRKHQFLLILVRIVECVVQAAALMTCHCLLYDQICHIDAIPEFAYLPRYDRTLEQAFGLFVEYFEAV